MTEVKHGVVTFFFSSQCETEYQKIELLRLARGNISLKQHAYLQCLRHVMRLDSELEFASDSVMCWTRAIRVK